jgi:ABC-type glutathione transport system ATPase component
MDNDRFSVRRGEVIGLVGESGCGESTLARCIRHLAPITFGAVQLESMNLATDSPDDLATSRRDLQMDFQGPFTSLNPHLTIYADLADSLLVNRLCPNLKVMNNPQYD